MSTSTTTSVGRARSDCTPYFARSGQLLVMTYGRVEYPVLTDEHGFKSRVFFRLEREVPQVSDQDLPWDDDTLVIPTWEESEIILHGFECLPRAECSARGMYVARYRDFRPTDRR